MFTQNVTAFVKDYPLNVTHSTALHATPACVQHRATHQRRTQKHNRKQATIPFGFRAALFNVLQAREESSAPSLPVDTLCSQGVASRQHSASDACRSVGPRAEPLVAYISAG